MLILLTQYDEKCIAVINQPNTFAFDTLPLEKIVHGGENIKNVRQMLKKFADFGCGGIWIHGDTSTSGKQIFTEFLIVELPTDAKLRRKFFIECDKIDRKTGYDGEFDHGQKYKKVSVG